MWQIVALGSNYARLSFHVINVSHLIIPSPGGEGKGEGEKSLKLMTLVCHGQMRCNYRLPILKKIIS